MSTVFCAWRLTIIDLTVLQVLHQYQSIFAVAGQFHGIQTSCTLPQCQKCKHSQNGAMRWATPSDCLGFACFRTENIRRLGWACLRTEEIQQTCQHNQSSNEKHHLCMPGRNVEPPKKPSTKFQTIMPHQLKNFVQILLAA